MRLRNGKVIEIVFDALPVAEVMADDLSSNFSGSNEVEGNDRSHSGRSEDSPPQQHASLAIPMDNSFAIIDPRDTGRSAPGPDSIPPEIPSYSFTEEDSSDRSNGDQGNEGPNPPHSTSMVPYPSMTEYYPSTNGTLSDLPHEPLGPGDIFLYDSFTDQQTPLLPSVPSQAMPVPTTNHGVRRRMERSFEVQDHRDQRSTNPSGRGIRSQTLSALPHDPIGPGDLFLYDSFADQQTPLLPYAPSQAVPLPSTNHGVRRRMERSFEVQGHRDQRSTNPSGRGIRSQPMTDHPVNGNQGSYGQTYDGWERQPQSTSHPPRSTGNPRDHGQTNGIHENLDQETDRMNYASDSQSSMHAVVDPPRRRNAPYPPIETHRETSPIRLYDQTSLRTPPTETRRRESSRRTRPSNRPTTGLHIPEPSMSSRPPPPPRPQDSYIPPYSTETPQEYMTSPPPNPYTPLSPTNPFQTDDPPWSPGAASSDLRARRQSRLPEHPGLPSSGSYRHPSFGSGFGHANGVGDEMEHDLEEMGQLQSQLPPQPQPRPRAEGGGRHANRRQRRSRDRDGNRHHRERHESQHHSERVHDHYSEEEADSDVEMGENPRAKEKKNLKRKNSSPSTGTAGRKKRGGPPHGRDGEGGNNMNRE